VLGDAAESIVHLAAVLFASFSLSLLHKPADDDHPYGHSKIAFFSAGMEGVLIILAALFLIYESLRRWLLLLPPAHLSEGLLLTAATILINLTLGWYLLRIGKEHASLILTANGRHVLTDAWTSLGSLFGLGLVASTGWARWDALCGLLMAANILWTGCGLMRHSIFGLMDTADPKLHAALEDSLQRETQHHSIRFHALRHRDAGGMHYVEVHLLFPDHISLREAHRIATQIEHAVQSSLSYPILITTHLECQGDHDELHQHGEASDPNAPRPSKAASLGRV
jgi:cation diffusion facilitator family transporter